MDNRKIIAGMATIPDRKEALKEAIESLVDQVDVLYVYCNGCDVEDYYETMWYPNVAYLSDRKWYGDLGDAGKLLLATEEVRPSFDAYFFAVDDDIIYPQDYCMYLISKMKKWDNRKVVGIHGKKILGKLDSYYRDRGNMKWFHNQRSLLDDTQVHILGTGLIAFPNELVTLQVQDLMQAPRNSADIHFAKICQRDEVGMMCVGHSERYVKLTDKIDHQNGTIYGKLVNNDQPQTEAVNEVDWQYF